VLLAGVLLAAVNFRPAITSVPPLLPSIAADTGLGYAGLGLLTTIPALCMGAFAIASPRVRGALGALGGLRAAALLIGLAAALRYLGESPGLLLVSAFAAGMGIAVGQVLVPVVIKEHFAGRIGFVTGLFSTTMNVGATLGAATAVPFATLTGSWQSALAIWWIPAAFAAVCLSVPAIRSFETRTQAVRIATAWKDRHVWLSGLLVGLSSILYYSGVAWLAPRYMDLGWSSERAGYLLSICLAAQIAASLVIPAVSQRGADRRPWLAGAILLHVVPFASVAIVPMAAPWVSAVALGLGFGALFPLVLTVPIDYARDAGEVTAIMSVALGIGYTLAALGPLAVGLVRDSLGSYDAAFLGLVLVAALMLVLVMRLRPRGE
jgi:CP family cyanate transporter-like MFS transporter